MEFQFFFHSILLYSFFEWKWCEWSFGESCSNMWIFMRIFFYLLFVLCLLWNPMGKSSMGFALDQHIYGICACDLYGACLNTQSSHILPHFTTTWFLWVFFSSVNTIANKQYFIHYCVATLFYPPPFCLYHLPICRLTSMFLEFSKFIVQGIRWKIVCWVQKIKKLIIADRKYRISKAWII